MSEITQDRKVLALKYRPHTFKDLVGQSTVSQTLSLALDSNRLSHAYLFSGLRGSGKTSTARIMAKALLCQEGPTSNPCEICNNCISANTNRHLDIIEMDAASNRGIDDIKDLIEHTKYKPSSARFKVFIIDEVHMLTTQAFNALLKTLEEPPGFVKFILATTDPLKLPATILSRTQHFRFNKIATSDVIHHLSHILNEENLEFQTDALEILARSGQGSLRDTLTLLDQAIIFSKGEITTSTVVDMLGLIDPKVMDNIFTTVLNKGDITSIVKELEVYEISQVCDEMSIYLKHKMMQKDARFDILLFDRFFRIIGDAKQLLAINSDGGFVLILTLLKMIEATSLKSIDEIINQVKSLEVKEEVIVKTIPEPKVVQEVKKVQEKVILEEPPISNYENQTPGRIVQENEEQETHIQTVTSLDIVDVIPTVNYPTPFDDLPLNKDIPISTPKEEIKEQVKEEKKEFIEAIVKPEIKEQVSVNTYEEIEVVPFEEEIVEEVNDLYANLTEKVYDRDYSLGECFEKNFIFNGYENNKLKIISYAQDDDRKFLYKHFGLIKTFAQDVYGNEIELDFSKAPEEQSKKKTLIRAVEKVEKQEDNQNNSKNTGSMIESIEMSSGCVADMHKSSNPTPAQKELELDDVMNSRMLNKAKELFDIKKITVKARS